MKIHTSIILLILLAFAVNLTSCGVYGFRPKNPPEGVRTLAVPLFDDVSTFSDANLRENFTERLKSEIINDNTFYLTDRSEADGVLICTITDVTDEPLVITGNETVTKRRINISVNVDFQNLNTQRKIWERQFQNWGEYRSSATGFTERDEGIREAVNKICEDILNDITSNW